MKLDVLNNNRSAINGYKIASIIAIICAFGFSFGVFFIMNQELKKSSNIIYTIDSKGNVSVADKQELSPQVRVFEYENHVKTFYRLWYSLDQNSYKGNIEQALWLTGECGKELYNDYKAQDIYGMLRSKNIITTVSINEIKIDPKTIPITGYIKGIQTIKRLNGEMSRNMVCSFSLYDVDRSRENPHGVKIENWKVIDNSEIKNEEANQ